MDSTKPLWMPSGSVRSIIALAVVVAYIVTDAIAEEVLLLVLGFYFGSRNGA